MATVPPPAKRIRTAIATHLHPVTRFEIATSPLTPEELRALQTVLDQQQPMTIESQMNFALKLLESMVDYGPRLFKKPLPLQYKQIEIGPYGRYRYTTRNGTTGYLTDSQTRRCQLQGYLEGPDDAKLPCPHADKLQYDIRKKRYIMPVEYRPLKKK